MEILLTDQRRLALLVFLCGLLWSLESLVPLYQYGTTECDTRCRTLH
jgi:hypothetical protein